VSDGHVPLEPAYRVRPGVPGTIAEIAGVPWVFAAYIPYLDYVWDQLFDQNMVAGRYEDGLLVKGGLRLLAEANDLTEAEAVGLIAAAKPADLVRPVEVAFMGADPAYRSYSDWARSALWANGIDPESVPPAVRRDTLVHLVETGRAVPAEDFVSSAEAATARAALARMGARRNGHRP